MHVHARCNEDGGEVKQSLVPIETIINFAFKGGAEQTNSSDAEGSGAAEQLCRNDFERTDEAEQPCSSDFGRISSAEQAHTG